MQMQTNTRLMPRDTVEVLLLNHECSEPLPSDFKRAIIVVPPKSKALQVGFEVMVVRKTAKTSDTGEDVYHVASGPASMLGVLSYAGFEVVTRIGDDFENVFREDDEPQVFKDLESARREILDLLLSTREAVATGDMAEEYTPDDYRIRNLDLGVDYPVRWRPGKKDIEVIREVLS